MAAAISCTALLVGGPLTALVVVKVMAAKKALGAVSSTYSAVSNGASALQAANSAPANQPVSNWNGSGQPNNDAAAS